MRKGEFRERVDEILRGYGSIEQIFRWAAEDQSAVEEKRPDDSFIRQIKRIAKKSRLESHIIRRLYSDIMSNLIL
jgi:hypothetical protein